MSCASLLFGQEFSPEEIAHAKASHGLLTMEVEVGTACHFRCRYCYVGESEHSTAVPGELSLDEIRDVIGQAQKLGARKIILLGGEPMLYEFTPELCAWIRSQGLGVEMFTNGTGITAEIAVRFFELGVHVVLKWHSANSQVQDFLAGVPGASVIMEEAYRHLRAAGYPSAMGPKLAMSTVICRQNIAELPSLWQWMRTEGIEPYFEMITPQGRARSAMAELAPSSAEVQQLFETIREMDRTQFGREWVAQPPLVGNVCMRHAFSVLVAASGEVMPCVGVSLPVGNIRKNSLASILQESEVIADLRNPTQMIQGACGECERAAVCYGCRGAAFQQTGNYLGSDPLCWHNQSEGAKECSFPMSAARLVPHQAPARMVTELVAVGEKTATVMATVTEQNPFVQEGRLMESAHIELMAQAAAALHGYRTALRRGNAPQRGLLVGARQMEIFAPIRVGDVLHVHICKQARLGTFGVIAAQVFCGEQLVSKAELKTWHEE